MAELSSILFPIGVVFVALAFAAHVGHAVMLANGRRVALPAMAARVTARVRRPRDRVVRHLDDPGGLRRSDDLAPRRARCRAPPSG